MLPTGVLIFKVPLLLTETTPVEFIVPPMVTLPLVPTLSNVTFTPVMVLLVVMLLSEETFTSPVADVSEPAMKMLELEPLAV